MATIDCADNLVCATLSGSNGIGVGLVTGTPNKIVVSASNIPNSALENSAININGTTISLGATGSLESAVNLNGQTINIGTTASLSIGDAEDGDYTDGLFTDFISSTEIGTAIDRFNEVLKGLAPQAAPNLSNLERNAAAGSDSLNGKTMKLSFGNTSGIAGYTNVTASLSGLSNVDIGGTFTISNGSGGGGLRLGAFRSLLDLTMSLNNNIPANADAYVNYPAKAFNVATDGVGSYVLEINGTDYVPSGSTIDTASATTNNFSLTTANTGTFIGSGQSFPLFRHRTGTVAIPTAAWRFGHNYAKVTHISSLGNDVTNYVDWIYDSEAASGNSAYSFSSQNSSSFNISGIKYLSGIKYYTSLTYNFTTLINNFYKNVYSPATDGGITFGSLSSGLTAAAVASIPAPSVNTDTLPITSSHSLSNVRVLGIGVASTLSINNTLGKTGNSTLTTNTMLFDNLNTANSTLEENFCLENYRVPSSSYDTQNAASTAIGAFPSSNTLATEELAVYNGSVRYPKQVLNNGNVAGSGVTHMITSPSQPDYSSASGDKYYYRVFRNGSNARATFTVEFTGSSGFTVVPYDSSLGATKFQAWIKVPGTTGWRDISTATPAPGYTPTADNLGALQGSVTSTATTSKHDINLLTEGMQPNDYFVMRIKASQDLTANITRINITGL